MGKVVAITSQKGGVGKTTTVLNLGFSLSRLGQRVLLVDGDPQGGLGLATNLKKKSRGGLVDVLRGRLAKEDVITVTRDGLLSVVGCGVTRPEDVLFLEQQAHAGTLTELLVDLAGGAEHTLLDCPGGIGGLVHSLFAASDSVLGVINCRALAVRSLPSLLKTYQDLRASTKGSLRFEGLLVTMFDPRSEAEHALFERLRTGLPANTLFNTVIPVDDRVEQASARSVPLAMLAGPNEVARAYLELAMELRARDTRSTGGADDDAGLF